MRIAVLGGAFDPIHNGHLQIAKQAVKQLRIDEVWFMPSAATPLKQEQAASFQDRAAMISLAIAPYRHMKLCTLEQELEGVSYTPYALLASRTTASGRQYRILCKATVVYPGAEMHYAVVDVYESLEGNANIIGVTDGYVS